MIDVPGFEFFKNPENDKLGMEAAKTADLVLFLITNEEPTTEDLQCLAQLKILGKKICGVVNVKKKLSFKKHDMALKNLHKTLSETEEVEKIIAQIKNSAKNYHQNWDNIKFFATHLEAAYHATQNNDAELYQASKFTDIENYITEKVCSEGQFLRIKNFVDSIAVPMNDILLKIFEHSGNSLKESKIWLDKSKKIRIWRKDFWERSQHAIYKLFSELSENLKHAIPDFVEAHYNDQDINEQWSRYIKDFGYVERYQELLKNFSNECVGELKKFGEELMQELQCSLNGKTQTNILVDNKIPLGKDASIVLPNLLLLVPKMGWTAKASISVGSTFFKSLFGNNTNKVREAKDKVYKQLTESSFGMLNKINNQARDVFNRQILGSVDEFVDVLTNYNRMLTRLGESQSALAETLIDEYTDLNSVLFIEAVEYKGSGKIEGVKATIRIPGAISVIIAEKSDVNTQAISELLGEKFFVVEPMDSWEKNIQEILGCDFELNAYLLDVETNDKTYSVNPKGELSLKRAKLAQQISPYPIIVD